MKQISNYGFSIKGQTVDVFRRELEASDLVIYLVVLSLHMKTT